MVPTPAGLTVRGYQEVTDAPLIFEAYVEAFADHWGEEHPDEEAWWVDHRDGESVGYAPDLWQVAMDGDRLAGFVTARIQQDLTGRAYGYIGDLGVRPAWRGRGLGECLLTRSIDLLQDRGMPYVELHVDTENTSGAIRLYTKVGMEPRPSFTIWSIDLAEE
jgi:ribosomal protein S18 acetylase RimI-like enzyme